MTRRWPAAAVAAILLFALMAARVPRLLLPSASAAGPLRVSSEYIYEYNDRVLRKYPSRYGGITVPSPYKTAHDEYAKEIVSELKRILAPLESGGAYVEKRPFVDEGQTGFFNILGVVPGADPVLSKEFVLVGGHWDCVPWTYDGAIDCGMQVALTLGVAKAFVDYWVSNDLRPQRSMMVVFFDAEEQTLFGSAGFTTTDYYRGINHLELPPQASVVAYHDTDMIGANYPGRYFGRSDLDFMPLNVFGAPTYLEGHNAQARGQRSFVAYNATAPGFALKFIAYREAMKAARDRLFNDMRSKFGYFSYTYRDGQTRPLFTESQKKYVNILDDPFDRSDHTVLIVQGIPSEINIGLTDPNSTPPGLVSYHNAGETLEFLNYMYSGQQRKARETLLGLETASMAVAYMMGANHAASDLFLLGETGAP